MFEVHGHSIVVSHSFIFCVHTTCKRPVGLWLFNEEWMNEWVARLSVPTKQPSHVNASLGRPPYYSRKCRPSRSCNNWLQEQIRPDSGVFPADLWRRAIQRGHGATLRPRLITRWWWWCWWLWVNRQITALMYYCVMYRLWANKVGTKFWAVSFLTIFYFLSVF